MKDPLRLIPSAECVRQKIVELQEQSRKLRIVLRTAEEIEQVEQKGKTDDSRDRPQTVSG
jgi:hypothetical protein